MQAVPGCCVGAFRGAIQVALQEILAGSTSNDEVKNTRGWKLLLPMPRMILFRPGREVLSNSKLEARITSFQRGLWSELLAAPKRMGRVAMRSATSCCVTSPGSLPKMVLMALRIPASCPADWLGSSAVLMRW